MDPNDELLDLVKAAQRGDSQAFTELVLRTEADVRRILRFHRARAADLDDLAAETYLAAWRGIRGLDKPSFFGGWLAGIAENMVKQLRLRTQREERRLEAFAAEIRGSEVVEPVTVPEVTFAELILHAPRESRDMLEMFYREEMSRADIATHHGLSVTSVDHLLGKARQAIRWALHMEP